MTMLVDPPDVEAVPEPEQRPQEERRAAFTARDWAIALVAITALVYWNSFAGQFVFDDILQITDNPNIRRLWPLADWQRPLGYLTFQLNYAWGGYRPAGYHLVNLFIHLGNALLLFGIARNCLSACDGSEAAKSRTNLLAFAIAAIWSVHPLTTSAVTYTVQRLESLMALCFLGCLYAVLQFNKSKHPRRWQLAAVVAMSLGVLTKEVMITCWPVAILFDRAFVAGSWREVWGRRKGFYLLLALPLAWTFITMGMTNAEDYAAGFGFRGVTPWEYLRSQPLILLHYLRLSFWPDVLLLDYGWPVETSPLNIYLPGLVILALLGLSLWCAFKVPRIGCVALGAFLVLAPSSSIMPIADLCFEHRMYLPLMAVVALVVLGVNYCLSRGSTAEQRARIAIGALTIVLAGLGYRTTLRNGDYANPLRLWEKNVAARPAHARPHLLLAMLYDRAGRDADAGRAYRSAVSARPDYHKGLLNLGGWCFRHDQLAEAAECFERATQVEPKSAAGFAQWGRTLSELGDSEAARAQLQTALKLDPYDPVALRTLAWVLVTSPNPDDRDAAQARDLLRRLPPDPQQQDVWRLDVLAATQAEAGEFSLATTTAELALQRAEQQKRSGALQEQIRARIDTYRANKPWRSALKRATSEN